MPRGGKRPGAGRPKGRENKRTTAAKKIATRARTANITPLDVMLDDMLWHLAEAKKEKKKGARGSRAKVSECYASARAAARDAAPYIHPKLTSIAHTGPEGGPIQIDKIEHIIVYPKD